VLFCADFQKVVELHLQEGESSSDPDQMYALLLTACALVGHPVRPSRLARAHVIASSPAVSEPLAVATAVQPTEPPPLRPPEGTSNYPAVGQLEDALFEQSESVAIWRGWNEQWDEPNVFLDSLFTRVREGSARSPARAAAYWAYHLGRSSFFAAQWSLAYLAFQAQNAGSSGSSGPAPNLLQTSARVPRLLGEALTSFADDYQSIDSDKYALPYDMVELTHRQNNPLFALRESALFATEAAANLARRGKPPIPLWLKAADQPQYYNTFHYQTDGYMSSRSAAVYDMSTESLFLGRQDAMQRLTLVPISNWLDRRAESASADGARKADLLELGAGTGRFLTFLLDSFGERVNPTALELSPFYLERARANVEYAAKLRRWKAGAANVQFLLGNAERVPLADASQDIIASVYMFHELPPDAHRAIAREVGRLLRPGGLFVLTDSLQLGDRPAVDAEIPAFSALNEPYYDNFIRTSFADVFAKEAGLVPEWKGLRSVTKTLSFRKPE
jgi:SAM-dependent methyltransferase